MMPPDGEMPRVAARRRGRRTRSEGRQGSHPRGVVGRRRRGASQRNSSVLRRPNEVARAPRVTVLGELSSGTRAASFDQPLAGDPRAMRRPSSTCSSRRTGAEDRRGPQILADIVEERTASGSHDPAAPVLLRKGEVQSEDLELPVLVDDVVRLVRGDLAHHGVSFTADLPAGLPRVRGDPRADRAGSPEPPDQRLRRHGGDGADGPAARPRRDGRRGRRGARVDPGCPGNRGLGARARLRAVHPPPDPRNGPRAVRLSNDRRGARRPPVGGQQPRRGATFHFTLPVAGARA